MLFHCCCDPPAPKINDTSREYDFSKHGVTYIPVNFSLLYCFTPSDVAVGTIKQVYVKSYHDGFAIQWDGHNFTDNQGTTYYLQKATGEDAAFTKLSRGNLTKFNYREKLEDGMTYRYLFHTHAQTYTRYHTQLD